MNRIMCGLSVGIVAGCVLLSSCSTNLGPETLPSTTPATETTVETEPTETTTEPEIPEHTEPYSQAIITGSLVESYGALSVDGTKITNSEGQTVVLKGMSSFGIQECGDFFTFDVIKTLAEDWGCDVLRIAITGDSSSEGYLKDPDKYFDMLCKIVDNCQIQGIYVIIDWNILYGEEYDEHQEAAVDFFKRFSSIYAYSPNVIYEINNDPLTPDKELEAGEEWEEYICPFVTEVIDAIRGNGSDSLIIVGTPDNSTSVDAASDSPLDYSNIAYSARLLSGLDTDTQKEKLDAALDDEVCVFVTQWGLTNDLGGGGIHVSESLKWIEFFDENQISWCNYAIGSYSSSETNALNLNNDRYTDEQKTSGHWPAGMITESGSFIREEFLKTSEEPEPGETTETEATEETEQGED